MASPGKWCKGIIKDPVSRETWFRRYVHHKNLYCKGESEIGFFRQAFFGFQSMAVGWLFIRNIWPDFPTWVIWLAPLLLMVKTAVYWSVGYFWDRNRIFDHEHSWGNQRNPIMKYISHDLLKGGGLK
jgi:hypothetical protein